MTRVSIYPALTLGIACVSISSGIAFAGEIYGELRTNGRTVPAGEAVRLQCPGNVASDAKTDRFGSYKIFVPASGRCVLSFRQAKFDVSIPVEGATRYNFEYGDTSGNVTLQRR